jgi:SAM-dependent methyltransferase
MNSPLFTRNAKTIKEQVTNCGLCGSDASKAYATSYDYEYQTCANKWQFVRCDDCQNIYLNPRPANDEIPTIYPPNYYSYNYEGQLNSLALKAKEIIDKRTFSAIIALLDDPIDHYFDIGCGTGRYLCFINNMGVPKNHIYGIELNDSVTQRLRQDGFQAFSSPLEELDDLPKNTFQLITLFSVLEHVASPRDLMIKAYEILAPGGLLVFEVPNAKSTNAKLFKDRYWGGYHTPRHWNLFSAETIESVALSLGYTFIMRKRTPGHAFWPWSLHHFFRYAMGWDKFGKLFNPSRCIPLVALVTAIDNIRALLKGETDNMIIYLKK